MTPDDKKRLVEITERHRRAGDYQSFWNIAALIGNARDDIGFLIRLAWRLEEQLPKEGKILEREKRAFLE